jgi:hypothetical protein
MWLTVLVQILPSLISLAERLLGPKTGEAKKDLVMSAVEIAMTAVGVLSTGGQAQTWDKLRPLVSQVVDAIVAMAFPKQPAGTAFGGN